MKTLLFLCLVAPSKGSGDWIRTLLSHTSFGIPNVSIPVTKWGGKTIDAFNATSIICSNISIGLLSSDYRPPLRGQFNITSLNAACIGDWSYGSDKSMMLGGKARRGPLTIGLKSANMSFQVLLTAANDTLIDSSKCTECGLEILPTVNLGKSFPAEVLEALEAIFKKSLMKELNATGCATVSRLVDGPLSLGLHNLSAYLRNFTKPVSPLPMPQAPSDAWNLNEAAPLQFLDYFLGTYLGTSGRFNVNTLTDFLAPGGVLNLTTLSTVNHTISLGNHTTLMAKIGPVIISGLDTVSTFDVLKVAGAQLLNTTVALKRLSFNATVDLIVDFHGRPVNPPPARQQLVLSGAVDDPLLGWIAQLDFSRSKSAQLHGGEAINFECLLETTEALNTSQLILTSGNPKFLMDFGAGGNIDADFDAMVQTLSVLILSAVDPVLPRVLRGMVGQEGRAALNAGVEAAIANATCSEKTLKSEPMHLLVLCAIISLAAALLCSMWVVCAGLDGAIPLSGRYNVHMPSSLNSVDEAFGADDSASPLLPEDDSTAAVDVPRPLGTRVSIDSGFKCGQPAPCLARSSLLPWQIRHGVILTLFASIGLNVAGDLSTGAQTLLSLEVDGVAEATPSPLYYLSLMGSTEDMWTAGVYPLAIFIAITNIVWPLIRLLLLGGIWFSPTGVISAHRRGTILVFCDQLGKWTAAQQWVASLMTVAFKYHAKWSDGTLYGVSGGIDIVLAPDWWGEWGIITGTTLGLITSSVMLWAHRRVVALSGAVVGGSSRGGVGSTEAHPSWEGRRHAARAGSSPMVQKGVSYGLALCFLGVTVGSVIPAFNFEYRGLTGIMLVGTGAPTNTTYSVVSMASALPVVMPSNPGAAGFLEGIIELLCLFVPVAHIIAVFILWMAPMGSKLRRIVRTCAETLAAWAALDVLSVSILLGFLQISRFASFIVGEKCDLLAPLLSLPQVNTLLDGDDKCLDVEATLLPGVWVLLVSSFGAEALGAYIITRDAAH